MLVMAGFPAFESPARLWQEPCGVRPPEEETMPVVLLALFFVLLMYDPRAAFVSLGLAIVLLYRGRSSGARRNTSRQVSDISDGSI
jgi:hypothetical protein